MLLKFAEIEETVLPHFKGGEGAAIFHMYTDDKVRIMKGCLEPGSTVGMHKHEGSCETVFILSGEGKTIVDGVEEILGPGCCSHCAEGQSHTLINTGKEDLVFYAVVPQVKG